MDNTPNEGIQLDLEVSTDSLQSGGSTLGITLDLGNSYGYGVSDQNTRPHPPTIFPVGSPLYNVASTLEHGDIVVFGGTFVPFNSPQACYGTIAYATYFSLFHFSSIRKIGSDPPLEF